MNDDHPSRRDVLAGIGAVGLALVACSGTRGAGASLMKEITMNQELKGKVAIVTGARNNLGRAFAIALAGAGADVLVHYHREETRAEADETAKQVRAAGGKVALSAGDLGVRANVTRMYETATRELGGVDIVVNNAGFIRKRPFVEITDEELERSIAINTRGLFLSMQEAARRIRDDGRIINIGTSLLGATTGMYSVYAGTKAPAEHFTRALAKEIGARGVTVNTIAPGAVDTPFFHGEETPQSVEYVKKAHVAGRLATVDDIVGTVVFLASPRAAWVSAQTIFVNNAYLAR
jgi:NAD(P)-dependent dehydrogenase (short-subunit alcohol dehydrogenase family)